MDEHSSFLGLILDTISEQIAVIDTTGVIQYVNHGWMSFSCLNEGADLNREQWIGSNYLSVCDNSAAFGDEYASLASCGIRKVINAETDFFRLDYPCDISPMEPRWFMMTVKHFMSGDRPYLLVTHYDITQRKVAEQQVKQLALQDSLTLLPNRRDFMAFYQNEFERCRRMQLPLSLAVIDIDYFKKVNDRYGHAKGDESLIRVGNCVKECAQRPSDHCCRYGGEEFLLIWGEISHQDALVLAYKLIESIRSLAIPNQDSPVSPYLTISVGLISVVPSLQDQPNSVIEQADKLLYQAKNQGRNQVCNSDLT